MKPGDMISCSLLPRNPIAVLLGHPFPKGKGYVGVRALVEGRVIPELLVEWSGEPLFEVIRETG